MSTPPAKPASRPSRAPERRAPRRRPKGRRTAERILDSAELLFAENGYDGTTLRDVATAVGIQNPSLYNHFRNKNALYGAVLERGIRPVLEALSRFVDEQQKSDDASRRLIEQTMALMAQRPNLARLIQHETLSGGHRLTEVLHGWIAPVFERAGELVASSPAVSRWKPEQIPLLVLALYHVIVGYFATAPLYHELTGEDLMSEPALARQTQFFGDLVEALLGER